MVRENVKWALPTSLIIPAFHRIGVDQKFRRDCFEKFLMICRTAAPGCPKHRLESLCY
jgi:hypothetical protein